MKRLLSRRGYRKLKVKLKDVESEQRKIGEEIRNVVSDESRKDTNSAFMELRRELMYSIPLEIRTIMDILNNSVIIEETLDYKKADCTKVFIGCYVDLIVDGVKENYWILGENEYDENCEMIIPCNAPFAKAILGASQGQTIRFRNMEIFIEKIIKSNV